MRPDLSHTYSLVGGMQRHPSDRAASRCRHWYAAKAGWTDDATVPGDTLLVGHDGAETHLQRLSPLCFVPVSYQGLGPFPTLAHAFHYVRARAVGCHAEAEALRAIEDPLLMTEWVRTLVDTQVPFTITAWEERGHDLNLLRSLHKDKFGSQATAENVAARKDLEATGKSYLLHASPCTYFGMGLRRAEYQRRLSHDPRKIPGRNWNGLILMETRALMDGYDQRKAQYADLDAWIRAKDERLAAAASAAAEKAWTEREKENDRPNTGALVPHDPDFHVAQVQRFALGEWDAIPTAPPHQGEGAIHNAKRRNFKRRDRARRAALRRQAIPLSCKAEDVEVSHRTAVVPYDPAAALSNAINATLLSENASRLPHLGAAPYGGLVGWGHTKPGTE